jgi:hypothetical protein
MYNFSPILQTGFLFYLLMPFVLAILLAQETYQQLQTTFDQRDNTVENVKFTKSMSEK